MKAKSLLIHNDTKNNKTTAMVVEEKDILQKTKEFLKKISANHPKAIILSPEGETKSYAVAYEEDEFIIVAHKDSKNSAKLYGNWDEALASAKRLLSKNGSLQTRIVLAEYSDIR